jgi:hypothetical protein
MLGAVLNMKSEYYLLISLLGILLLFFGLFGMMRNSHKNLSKGQVINRTGDAVGTKDMTKYPPTFIGAGELKNVQNGNTSCFSYLCPVCGKVHTICQSGNIDYFISPHGEKIMIGH